MSRFASSGDGGAVLSCKVLPSSSKNEITEVGEEFVKIKLTSAPVDGKANKGLIVYLSKFFKIPKSRVEIIKGETSKQKKVLLTGLTVDEVIGRLGK